jgi:uncharacterized protein Smg (DUF494 family)
MKEYLFSDLQSIESININQDRICINSVIIFDVDELRFQEEREAVHMTLLNQDKEIAEVIIQQSEKLILDDAGNYYLVPEDEGVFE